MKKEIKISAIHCAGCALALEDKIKQVEGVNNASLDFISKTVTLDIENKDSKQIIKKVEQTIIKFDKSIKIINEDQEQEDLKKQKISKIIEFSRIGLSVILLIVAILLNKHYWISFGFYVASYLIAGYPVIIDAVKNIFKGKMLDEKFLMMIATIGAFVLQEFVEAVAVMLFYLIGEILQELAVEKSQRRIKELFKIKADHVNLIIGNDEIVTELSKVKVGDLIRIKPGEKVPLDCTVIEGNSHINTAVITGESKDSFAKEGTKLLSGCINEEGVLLCKVDKNEQDSTVTKIINLVENASKKKAKTEKFITKFAKYYTPIVVGIAVCLAIVPSLIVGSFTTWIYRALVFLVVSCPCALIVSVPLSYFAGIGASARNGIMIKGATYIDLLAKANKVIFDKTGTLTHGDFEVSYIYADKSSNKDEVLEFIAYAESFSNHRIAKSITNAYTKQVNTAWITDYQEIAGKGIKANIFGEDCLVGNSTFMKENQIEFKKAQEIGTIVYLAKSNKFMGYVIVSDKLKRESLTIVQELKECGIDVVSMFTGDNNLIAEDVAKRLNLDCFYADLLPQDKVDKLQELKEQNKSLIFVGDGINDAPVLSSVDVGISMGGVASDIAIESADVVLMSDNVSQVADSILIAKKTKKIVMQNIIFTLFIKVLVLILSAIGISGMWLAIFADVGVCLLAVLNSLRAMFIPKKLKKLRIKRS